MTDKPDDGRFEHRLSYWERKRHEYAGLAMQGLCSNPLVMSAIGVEKARPVLMAATVGIADALIQELKK